MVCAHVNLVILVMIAAPVLKTSSLIGSLKSARVSFLEIKEIRVLLFF